MFDLWDDMSVFHERTTAAYDTNPPISVIDAGVEGLSGRDFGDGMSWIFESIRNFSVRQGKRYDAMLSHEGYV